MEQVKTSGFGPSCPRANNNGISLKFNDSNTLFDDNFPWKGKFDLGLMTRQDIDEAHVGKAPMSLAAYSTGDRVVLRPCRRPRKTHNASPESSC